MLSINGGLASPSWSLKERVRLLEIRHYADNQVGVAPIQLTGVWNCKKQKVDSFNNIQLLLVWVAIHGSCRFGKHVKQNFAWLSRCRKHGGVC